MIMTEEEITRDYRLSRDKQKQIGILADINLCSRDRIKTILMRNGAMKDTRKKGLISPRDYEDIVNSMSPKKPRENNALKKKMNVSKMLKEGKDVE